MDECVKGAWINAHFCKLYQRITKAQECDATEAT